MAADYRERILALARLAPVQPSGVAKALATNTIMAGAMLSELAAKGALRISTLKQGGSPLYYVPGNEAQLDQYVHVLNEKDQKTVTLLRTEGVLRDSTADPLTRVSLRTVKDFAKPLEVTHPGGKELFWKWHLLPQEEAERRIRGQLGVSPPPPAPVPAQPPAAPAAAPAPAAQPAVPGPAPVSKPAGPEQQTLVQAPVQPRPRPRRASRPRKPLEPSADAAYRHVMEFFGKSGMRVLEHRMHRTGLHDFVVEMETPLGRSTCHCRAISKARLTDADLGDAYAEGMLRRLPTVVLTAGQLTKAAEARLPALKGLGIKRI